MINTFSVVYVLHLFVLFRSRKPKMISKEGLAKRVRSKVLSKATVPPKKRKKQLTMVLNSR